MTSAWMALLSVLLPLFLAVSAAPALLAQQGRGVIVGTVTDGTGAGVPDATVEVANAATNITTTVKTGAGGEYVTPAISVGEYRVTVSMAGFKSVVRSGITLEVGQRAQVDLQLALGSVQDTIEVRADAPLVNTTDATLGDVIENKRITELPLNGRNALALMFLNPNVVSAAGPTNSGFADRGTRLSAVSINGGPAGINTYLLDGVTNNQSILGDLNVSPSVDAVQEFKVQSGAMSAEYGATLGGIVNMVTKSGSNALHGALYEFVRNDAFDARNTFSPRVQPYRYNQYGGSIGGPASIPKAYNGRDRTFFFFNIEQYRYSYGVNRINRLPTALERSGNFSELRDVAGNLVRIYNPASTRANPAGAGFVRDPFPNNAIPASQLDPVATKVLELFIPLPNRPPTNAFTNADNYISGNAVRQTMSQFTIRADQRVSEKNSAFFRFIYYKPFTNFGNGVPIDNYYWSYRNDHYKNWNAAFGDTHTFTSRLFNEFRLGVVRNDFPYTTASFGQNIVRKIGLPESVPDVQIPNFVIPGIPAPTTIYGFRGGTTWDVNDVATWAQGAHTFRFGASFFLQQGNDFYAQFPSGNFGFAAALTANPLSPPGTGSGTATFLTGAASTASAATYLGAGQVGRSARFFLQDDWRISRRLTLNLGIRYDYQPWAVERNNGLANFMPEEINPLNGLRGKLGFAGVDFGRSPLGKTPVLFTPRVGFAWDVTGAGKVVIRGGYGVFYQTNMIRDLFGNPQGFAVTTTTYNPPAGNTNFPVLYLKDGLPSAPIAPRGRQLGPSGFLGQAVTYDTPDPNLPTSHQWNFSLQRQLPGRWVIEAAYTGNRGVHLISWPYEGNTMDPQYLSLGNALLNNVPNPYAGLVPGALGTAQIARRQLLRPYPYYSSVQVRLPHVGNSIYHGGILNVQKKLSEGFVLLAAHTWSKNITDNVMSPMNFGGTDPGINGGAISTVQNIYNRRAERARDPIDVPHRFVLSGVYELPIGRDKPLAFASPALNRILGGWQTQGILVMQTGTPVFIVGANNQGIATRPNSTGRSAKVENPNQYRWFDTTAFRNPPDWTFGNVARTLPDVNGPGTVNLDLAVTKKIAVGERWAAEVRAEAFNVANRVNLGAPNGAFSPGPDGMNASSTFGTIVSARDPRILQFGVKITF